jgi:hypothetical protein
MDDAQTIDALLRTRIDWIKETGQPRWRAMHRGEKCELTMNDFPDEPLYTLKWRSERIDFDESPSGWSIPRS